MPPLVFFSCAKIWLAGVGQAQNSIFHERKMTVLQIIAPSQWPYPWQIPVTLLICNEICTNDCLRKNMEFAVFGLSKQSGSKRAKLTPIFQFNFCPGHPTACPKSLPCGLRTASDNWHWVTKRKRQEKQWHACTKRHQFNAVLNIVCLNCGVIYTI